MGVSQSTELCRCVAPDSVFVAENRQALVELLGGINDTADFSERGKTDEVDLHSHDHSLSRSSAGDEPEVRRFTEEELAGLFAPYTHLLLANHYIGDDALLSPVELQSSNKKATTDGEGQTAEVAAPSTTPISVLARNRYLQVLDLGFNYLTGKSVGALVESLGGLVHLRHLSLAGNQLGHEGCTELGRWLSTDPPLDSLSLFHCGLTDADLAPLLEGLRGGRNTHLKQLNLDLNFCTAVTLATVVQMVEGENETLAVVWLEGSPHDPVRMRRLPTDLSKRIEYACTSEGFFRSGRTYYNAADDSDGTATNDKTAARDTPAGGVSAPSVAATERFKLRRAVLTSDFAGLTPFPPDLLDRLEAALAPRLTAYVESLQKEHQDAVAQRAIHVVGASGSRIVDSGVDDSEGLGTDDEDDDGAGGASRSTASPGGATDKDDVHSPLPTHPEAPPQPRSQRQAGLSASRSARSRSGRRLPPLDSPERLQAVLTDALHLRAMRHGGTGRVGEKVLANGFDKVWMAPLKDSKGKNTIVNDAPNYLRACWCDPHDAAVPYAGTLHYHCVREEAIDYGAPTHPAAAKRDVEGKAKARVVKPKTGAGGSHSLSSTEGLPLIGAGRLAEVLAPQRKVLYKGCRGTGHRCASSTPAMAQKSSKHTTATAAPLPSARARSAAAETAMAGSSKDGAVFTNQSGLTVQLNYNPVIYFSSAYVPCADIVDDCTGY